VFQGTLRKVPVGIEQESFPIGGRREQVQWPSGQ